MSTLPSNERGSLVQLVLQPTRFCNIDCSYCYLPDRTRRGVMSSTVLSKMLEFLAESGLLGDALQVRWHAGEPLVAGRRFYAEAHDAIQRKIGGRVALEYSMQTNATLLDDEWCRLFAALNMRVGVSIDGPRQVHDAYRRWRSGNGSFDQVMRGIRALREAGLPFETISVITPVLLQHSEAFLDFMQSTGTRLLGLNVEESEGPNQSSAFVRERFGAHYRAFMRRLLQWEDATGIPVREFMQMRQTILGRDLSLGNPQNIQLKIITVDVDGNLYTFSPELAGLSGGLYEGFAIGNVVSDQMGSLVNSSRLLKMNAEILRGVETCRRECAYFSVCGGGAPVNKLYENGTFASGATHACQYNVKAIFDTVMPDLERRAALAGADH